MKKRKGIPFLPRVDWAKVNERAAQMEPDPDVPRGSAACETNTIALGSEQPAAKWAKRTDAPTTRFSRGAPKWSGGRIPEEEKRAAMDSLLSDMEAASAKGPNAALLRTWQSVHESWFGADAGPAFPLTGEKLRAAGAVFKARGYRSFPNYLTKAKQHHIRITGSWPILLDQEAREVKRSVRRGLGPSRQSEPLQVEKVAELPTEQLSASEPIVSGGPIGAWNLAVLGVFFILREIELSLSLASSVTLNFVTKVVSWLLPSSKTDSAALTTTREWRCLCDANTIWLCPFHAAVRQMEFLKDTFGDENGALPPGLPFFPSLRGGAVSKESVVETIKEWHRRAGISVVDADGNELLGGHSLRTGGAVLLASEGVHIYQIELMARWKSAMLIHYAKTAPLKKMSRDYVRNKVHQELHERLDELARALEEVKNQCASRRPTQLERAEFIAERIKGPLRSMAQEEIALLKKQLLAAPSSYIQNPDRRKTWHKASVDGYLHPPNTWRTLCGWPHGVNAFVRSDELPLGARKCDRCFPDSSSDSSSDDSTAT